MGDPLRLLRWAGRHEHSKRWQFVGFAGSNGSESRGIVDLMAIRRDHLTADKNFRIGDLFEIVFLQIKGGGAAWPTFDDVKRLVAVRRYYRAKAVVLASWKKGAEPRFYVLKRLSADRQITWSETAAVEIFGTSRRRLLPAA